MVRHGINTAQCDDETIQCEKKNNGTTKCDKSTVISDASNAQYDSRTVKCEKKKKKILPNVTKVQSDLMLILLNVTMEPSNVRKKKIKKPPNVTKQQSHVILELHNVRIEPTNVRKKQGTIKCDKSTIRCNVGTT